MKGAKIVDMRNRQPISSRRRLIFLDPAGHRVKDIGADAEQASEVCSPLKTRLAPKRNDPTGQRATIWCETVPYGSRPLCRFQGPAPFQLYKNR